MTLTRPEGGQDRAAFLRALYQDIIAARIQRQAVARRADIEAWLALVGVTGLRERVKTFNFWRDANGELQSAEYEFVSQASACHGATDIEIAETLWPDQCDGTATAHGTLALRVQKIRSVLRERKIVL